MKILLTAGIVSLVLLLATLIEVWRRTGHRTEQATKDAFRRKQTLSAEHPRLDFAVGVVDRPQQVSRRARETPRSMQSATRRAAQERPRSDRAYYKEGMGDLADPDLRPPADRRV